MQTELFPGLEDPPVQRPDEEDGRRSRHSPPEGECPGLDGCHGCLSWCDWCGDVSNVCDSPDCDSHLRPEDIERDIEGVEQDLRKTATQAWEDSRSLPDPKDAPFPARHSNDLRRFRNRTRCNTSDLDRLERQLENLAMDHRRAVAAGPRLVPRGSPRPFKRRGTW